MDRRFSDAKGNRLEGIRSAHVVRQKKACLACGENWVPAGSARPRAAASRVWLCGVGHSAEVAERGRPVCAADRAGERGVVPPQLTSTRDTWRLIRRAASCSSASTAGMCTPPAVSRLSAQSMARGAVWCRLRPQASTAGPSRGMLAVLNWQSRGRAAATAGGRPASPLVSRSSLRCGSWGSRRCRAGHGVQGAQVGAGPLQPRGDGRQTPHAPSALCCSVGAKPARCAAATAALF